MGVCEVCSAGLLSAGGSYFHKKPPSFSATHSSALRETEATCRTPPNVNAIAEAYDGRSLRPLLVHSSLPLFLSKAAKHALSPPAMQITLPPSTSGDSV